MKQSDQLPGMHIIVTIAGKGEDGHAAAADIALPRKDGRSADLEP